MNRDNLKKYIFLMFIFIVMTGCDSQYNLEITSDEIKENINLVIDKTLVGNQYISGEVEPDDRVTPFIQDDNYPIIDNYSEKYKKEVNEDNLNYYVKLNYIFDPNYFGDSFVINNCFERHEYINSKDYYEIKLSGNFYCYYGAPVKINLSTPNVVEKSNADSVKNNIYNWTIDKNDEADIYIKIQKQTKFSYYAIRVVFIVLIIILCVVIGIITRKILIRNKFDEV